MKVRVKRFCREGELSRRQSEGINKHSVTLRRDAVLAW